MFSLSALIKCLNFYLFLYLSLPDNQIRLQYLHCLEINSTKFPNCVCSACDSNQEVVPLFISSYESSCSLINPVITISLPLGVEGVSEWQGGCLAAS